MATDTFTGTTNNQALSAYSANWTDWAGTNHHECAIRYQLAPLIQACKPNEQDLENGSWYEGTFNADQYGQITIVSIDCGPPGPGVRMGGTSSPSGYRMYGWPNVKASLLCTAADNSAELARDTVTWSAGSIMYLSIEGVNPGTFVATYGGVVLPNCDGTTDSTLDAGNPGVGGYGFSDNDYSDNWEGGDLAAGGATILRQMMQHHGG